jgi:hypothetical protein
MRKGKECALFLSSILSSLHPVNAGRKRIEAEGEISGWPTYERVAYRHSRGSTQLKYSGQRFSIRTHQDEFVAVRIELSHGCS